MSFSTWIHAQEYPVSVSDLNALTLREIATFKLTDTSMSVPASPGLTTISSSSTRDYAHEFSKGIKKDPSQYEVFSKDADWLSWNAHLHALAATHGTSNILDPDYMPGTDDLTLFRVQQGHVHVG